MHVKFIIPGTLKQIARDHGELDWSSHQGANGEPPVWSEAKTEVKDKRILREWSKALKGEKEGGEEKGYCRPIPGVP